MKKKLSHLFGRIVKTLMRVIGVEIRDILVFCFVFVSKVINGLECHAKQIFRNQDLSW